MELKDIYSAPKMTTFGTLETLTQDDHGLGDDLNGGEKDNGKSGGEQGGSCLTIGGKH